MMSYTPLAELCRWTSFAAVLAYKRMTIVTLAKKYCYTFVYLTAVVESLDAAGSLASTACSRKDLNSAVQLLSAALANLAIENTMKQTTAMIVFILRNSKRIANVSDTFKLIGLLYKRLSYDALCGMVKGFFNLIISCHRM